MIRAVNREASAVAAVDAGVEQTCIGRVVGLRRKLGSVQEVVEPLGLFVTPQRIEEFRRFLGASQLGDAVECDHGAFHLPHGGAGHHHGAFREVQLSLCDLHALGSGSLAERGNRCAPVSADGQPDLPPDCAIVGRGEHIGGVGPERPQTRRPDFSDCVDQTLVVAKTAGLVSCFCQVVTDQTLEVVELAIGDEDGSVSSIALVTDVQQLDSPVVPSQALKGQLDIGEAFELHLQAQTVLHPGRLLRFSGEFRHVSKLVDLALQRRGVRASIPRRNLRAVTATRSRISIRLGFGDAVKDEMPAQSVSFFRHGSPRSLRCSSFYSSFSAILLRSLEHRPDIRLPNLRAFIDKRILECLVGCARNLRVAQSRRQVGQALPPDLLCDGIRETSLQEPDDLRSIRKLIVQDVVETPE